jgi:hypothetical protein
MNPQARTLLIIGSALLLASCGSDTTESQTKDSLSAKDSVKKAITESLPPDEDFKQFEWIYSSFVAAATYNVKSTDVFIDPEAGLWVISTNGALPQMVHVNSVRGVLSYKNDSLIPIDRNAMVCTLKNEEIPKPDCDMPSLWSKTGCFTNEHNTFKEEKIWEYAGLPDGDAKTVEELAAKIDRVVMNTSLHMKMYFMLKNGSWYLVFLDLRVPCSA